MAKESGQCDMDSGASESISDSGPFLRLLLWSAPRCMSTAFLRVLANDKNTYILSDEYDAAYFVGEDRISREFYTRSAVKGLTFMSVKKRLEDACTLKKHVISKDFARNVLPRLDAIPNGYQHAFLIRQPSVSLSSYHRVVSANKEPNWSCFEFGERCYDKIWQLHEHIVKNLHQVPVVIDSDDILENPPIMMKKFCDMVGIAFDESMLSWQAGTRPDFIPQYFEEDLWYGSLLSSNGLKKRTGERPTVDVSSLPHEFQRVISNSQPYYDKLYEKCIKLDS